MIFYERDLIKRFIKFKNKKDIFTQKSFRFQEVLKIFIYNFNSSKLIKVSMSFEQKKMVFHLFDIVQMIFKSFKYLLFFCKKFIKYITSYLF